MTISPLTKAAGAASIIANLLHASGGYGGDGYLGGEGGGGHRRRDETNAIRKRFIECSP